jgi:HEAT repeat protein
VRRSLAIVLLASVAPVASGGDPPAYGGLTVPQWAARLDDWSTFEETAAALAAGGPEAVEILDMLLRQHRALRRLPYVLEVLPDPRPLVPALVLLLADRQTEVRRAAAHALLRIGPAGAAAVPALICAMADADESVAHRASAALGAIGAPAVPALTAALADPRIRGGAAEALGTIGPAASVATAPLLLLLGDTTATWRERGNAADALGEIGAPAAVPGLARGLADPEDWVRRGCARALGKIGDAALPATPALLGALADAAAREEASGSIWRLGDPAVRALVERFRATDDRTALAAALAAGKRDAIPYVVPLLEQQDAPWLADAEAALALVGWEALYALPRDHPSAVRVADRVLREIVLRYAKPPERYRAVLGAPAKADPLTINATWETGSGHGFTLELCRGRWTPGGFSVRAMSYGWRRPRRVGDKEVETVAVRTTTIPRARAEAMLRMVLAATGITFEEERPSDGTFWSSSGDFHAAIALRTADATAYEDAYTGYVRSSNELVYARVVACTGLLDEGGDTCDWTVAAPDDDDRAFLAARLGRIEKDDSWVRERILLITKAIGDERCLAPLEAFLRTEPDRTPRDHGYAIDAYAAISGTDLRPTPFREEDILPTRLRYLEHFAKR